MKQGNRIPDKEATELWQRFRQGEIQAWSALLEGYYRTLFNYGRRLDANREVLHDCIQELFLTLWDSRANLNPAPMSVLFYLLRSFRNLLQKELKKQKRQQPDQSLPPNLLTASSVEDWLIDQEGVHLTDSRIKQLLTALPAREQEVLFLKYYENLSNLQIAELMDIRKQSVANLLHSGLQHLRKQWEIKFGPSSLIGLLVFCSQS